MQVTNTHTPTHQPRTVSDESPEWSRAAGGVLLGNGLAGGALLGNGAVGGVTLWAVDGVLRGVEYTNRSRFSLLAKASKSKLSL